MLPRLVLAELSLRGGSGMETRKWVMYLMRNVGFVTRAMLGRGTGKGLCGEGGGQVRGGEKL
jgi:hypothetical protein